MALHTLKKCLGSIEMGHSDLRDKINLSLDLLEEQQKLVKQMIVSGASLCT